MSCKQTEVPVVPGTLLPEDGPGATGSGARPDRDRAAVEVVTRAGTRLLAVVEAADEEWIWVRVGESRIPLKILGVRGAAGFVLPSGRIVQPALGPAGPQTEVLVDGRSFFVARRRIGSVAPALPRAEPGHVSARMAGRVVRVHVAVGQAVTRGQPLLVVEAMKMEDEVLAPRDGTVAEVLVREGDRIDRDALMVRLD